MREPPDLERCQTRRPHTWPHMPSFMTLGPVSFTRCENPPVWLASDGEGQMSLCDECKEVCEKVMAADNVSFELINGLDPLASSEARAVVAEQMLDHYHLLKVNLKTRQAIYHTLCARQASPGRQAEAYEAANQAQAELDQCKYEILELMGVDA